VVSFFRDKSSGGVFWILAVCILLHAHFFVSPPEIVISENDGLLSVLLQPLQVLPSIAISALYYSLVIIQALRLNFILDDLKMFQKQGLTTALCYILLTSLYPAWNNITPALIANSLIIWIIPKVARLYNSSEPKTLIYNIGLITGLIIILYVPSFPLILVVFFALAILRPFWFNEWFVLLLGILTPAYFLAAILFLNDNLNTLVAYIPQFQIHFISPTNKLLLILSSAILVILILFGFYLWQANNGKITIQARKNWSVILLMLLLLIPVIFIIKNAQFDYLLLLAVPAAAFASNALIYPKNNILPSVLFWCTVAVIVYNNWVAIKN
jgi:hypothetical protein